MKEGMGCWLAGVSRAARPESVDGLPDGEGLLNSVDSVLSMLEVTVCSSCASCVALTWPREL